MRKIAILLLFVSSVGFVGYRAYQGYKAKAASDAPRRGGGPGGGGSMMRLPLVDAAAAVEGSLEDTVMLVGSLRPIATVQVMSKIAGRIEIVNPDIGDFVRKGDLLARVEAREIQQQIEQADASLAVTLASIRQREVELANYARQVERFRQLYEDNLIARQDLEDLITRQQTSEAQLELSKAQYRQSEASLNQFRISLENTSSYSPMNGFVAKRYLHPGALVTMNTPILDLVDLSTMRMVVNVVEKDVVRISRGASVEVTVDAFPRKVFAGQIRRVSPVLDPATRTAEVEVYVSNPKSELSAEMFARVMLRLGGQHSGILIPREAMVYRGDQSGVFVLDENAVAFRPIEVGVTVLDQVEVLEGLKLGERVVTMGASLLKDGDRVRLPGEERFREVPSDQEGPPGQPQPATQDGPRRRPGAES